MLNYSLPEKKMLRKKLKFTEDKITTINTLITLTIRLIFADPYVNF